MKEPSLFHYLSVKRIRIIVDGLVGLLHSGFKIGIGELDDGDNATSIKHVITGGGLVLLHALNDTYEFDLLPRRIECRDIHMRLLFH